MIDGDRFYWTGLRESLVMVVHGRATHVEAARR
jgi:hypothetical protein